MKQIWTHIWILALVWLMLPAKAQVNIEIVSPKVEIKGGNVIIDLSLIANDIRLKSTEQYTVDFVLQGNGRQWTLPEVVYCGKQRYYIETRKDVFSEGEKEEPYHVYGSVKKNETYTLDYKLSLPYEAWMDHASLCYWKRLGDCYETLIEFVLVEDIHLVKDEEPLVWEPRPEVYKQMLYFEAPEVKVGKQRTLAFEVNLDYPNNETNTVARYGNNTRELQKAYELLNPFFDNLFITIDSIRLTGYSSPDDPAALDGQLAGQRSESLRDYFSGIFGTPMTNARIDVAEDWNGLETLIEKSNIICKQDVLSVINDPENDPETKKRILKSIENGAVWEQMKSQMFPKLRRIKVETDYTILNFTDKQLCEQIFIQPALFNAEEMFRTAFLFDTGSQEYLKAFEVALEYYPEETAVWYNAAAAYLSTGNLDSAARLLKKTKKTPQAMINLGVYYYIAGDIEKAEQCFVRAHEAGISKGLQNLQLLNKEIEY